MADPAPKRIPFDPQAICAHILRILPRLAPLKKTELNIAFYAEGANPFDLLLKPADKTVLEFLRDIPEHLDAMREVMAFNLLLKNEDVARQFGLDEIVFLPQKKKPVMVMQSDDPEIWVEVPEHDSVVDVSNGWLVDDAIKADRPMDFLKKVGGMTDELKLEVKRYFDFDFDGIKQRIAALADALETTEVNNIPEEKGKAIREGVFALVDARDLYRTPTAENKGPLGRLYELIGASIDDIEWQYEPFRQTFGALAWKIRQDIKASIPAKSNGEPSK